MIERQPDYEDERIRVWKATPDGPSIEQSAEDPTVMRIDVEREEVFESRTYRFRPIPQAFLFVLDEAAAQLSAAGISPEGKLVPFANELLHDTTFKFLAKRNKGDGLIDTMLVAIGGGDRSLLYRQERVTEEEYREAVHDFETGFLPEGVLADPLVTAREEWQNYAETGSLSEPHADGLQP